MKGKRKDLFEYAYQCPQFRAVHGLRQGRFSRLKLWLEREQDLDARLKILLYEYRASPQLFSLPQLVSIMGLFRTKFVIAVHMIKDKLLDVTCDEIIEFLNKSYLPPEHNLEVMSTISHLVIDGGEYIERILEVLPNFKEIHEKVRGMIPAAPAFSQIFGPISSNNVKFCIDISKYMGIKGIYDHFSRLDYVIYELHRVLETTLKEHTDFQFNFTGIKDPPYFSFDNTEEYSWENLEHKLDSITHAHGKYEFDPKQIISPQYNTIYLLLAGCPTHGCTDIQSLIEQTVQLARDKNQKITVHTMVFRPHSVGADSAVKRLLYRISQETGGTYRCVDPSSDSEEYDEHPFEPEDNSFIESEEFEHYFQKKMAEVPHSVLELLAKPSLYVQVIRETPDFKELIRTRQREREDIKVSHAKDKHGHHIYDIDVHLKGIAYHESLSWSVHRTYSEFAEFHNVIKSKLNGDTIFPPDPFFHLNDAHFLENRRALLQTYIQDVYEKIGPYHFEVNTFLLWSEAVTKAAPGLTNCFQNYKLDSLRGGK